MSGSNIASENYDLNTIFKNGFYYANNQTKNNPTKKTSTVIVSGFSKARVLQICSDGLSIAIRYSMDGKNWTDWCIK